MLSLGLEETIKWGRPIYVHAGQNIVGLSGFRAYLGLWFFQGALLADKKKKLVNAQEGRTKGMRQWRFESMDELQTAVVRAYVKEAMKLAESGQAVKPTKRAALALPPELATEFKANKKLQSQFEKLSPGRQREFIEYLSEAKQATTKANRLQKILPMISEGIGLNDRYRK
jgi:uncharacterized protein YdeI (YjbR/CyaY-like superfamily)